MKDRPVFDCDTYSYWCDTNEYKDGDRKFGSFINDGSAYEITDPDTPRPWLNYLCNAKVASAVSNIGRGFMWYKSSLFRITKYEHPIDYLPREFSDGRDIILTDEDSGQTFKIFNDYDELKCIHSLYDTKIHISIGDLSITFSIFIPKDDPCECWVMSIENKGHEKRKIRAQFGQIWSIARFGIHTAEEGIPYLSTPGENLSIRTFEKGVAATTTDSELPVEMNVFFISPQACIPSYEILSETRKDGRFFRFTKSILTFKTKLEAGGTWVAMAASGADEEYSLSDELIDKYSCEDAFKSEYLNVKQYKEDIARNNTCIIPDINLQMFLNNWFKHQLFLTFRYVRSGHIGYRDSLQDTWGYELVEPDLTKGKLLRILSHMKSDGSCPRNFSPFGIDHEHDMRNFMDSGTWIGLALTGYIKETGDTSILNENIRYLDDENSGSVEEHVWKALDLLFEKRGRYGLCLVGTGDWNDGIEGISKKGPAVSVWLTIAVFHFQNLMADLYKFLGDDIKEKTLRDRSEILKENVNMHGWDGEWYIYAFSGTGTPIGSHKNKEGRIHLNSNTWAVFTGIADKKRTESVMESIERHLGTPLGPALLSPPYVNEGDEVGRIAKLEPGTFENGSVYKHAVAFKVFADIASGDYEKAYRTLVNILPTNPDNPDSRRTSEPYCLGNYYCGPDHERFGQNFFSWFTGSPAWLLRAGYDEILGVKGDYEGLRISPKVPDTWNEFKVNRKFKGAKYEISFRRADNGNNGIWVDGNKIKGNLISSTGENSVSVVVNY